jgi:hypothetical protein
LTAPQEGLSSVSNMCRLMMELERALEEGIRSSTGGNNEWPLKFPHELGKRRPNIGVDLGSFGNPRYACYVRSIVPTVCSHGASRESMDGLS